MVTPDAVVIRPVVTDGDVETWVATYNLASPCRPEGVGYIQHEWSIAPDSTALIAERGGRPVGVAHVELDVWTPGSPYASGTIIVPPRERRSGVGRALYEVLSGWARDHDRTGLDIWCDAASRDAIDFWTHRGFAEVSRERLSHLDLSTAVLPDPVAPEGVVLRAMGADADIERGMYRVGGEGIEDIPGADAFDAGDFAQWRRAELGWPDLMRDCSVVAFAGGEVVGFATLVAFTARPGFAEHEMTAVGRDWRGRGLATAMKLQVIANARAAGLTTLEAMNEARNGPMLAVNERLGYRPVTAWVQLRGPLAQEG